MVANLFAGVGLPTLQQGACQIYISFIFKGLSGFRERQGAANSGKQRQSGKRFPCRRRQGGKLAAAVCRPPLPLPLDGFS
ncbi:hypothetical protein ACNFIA_21310 [Pseudomonas sp. NY15437]|uniref:hypothetical protein n=1 Tax=Pseudomonas sp. NY15437 TaxID=3400360 RepID=UPI003A8427F8